MGCLDLVCHMWHVVIFGNENRYPCIPMTCPTGPYASDIPRSSGCLEGSNQGDANKWPSMKNRGWIEDWQENHIDLHLNITLGWSKSNFLIGIVKSMAFTFELRLLVGWPNKISHVLTGARMNWHFMAPTKKSMCILTTQNFLWYIWEGENPERRLGFMAHGISTQHRKESSRLAIGAWEVWIWPANELYIHTLSSGIEQLFIHSGVATCVRLTMGPLFGVWLLLIKAEIC